MPSIAWTALFAVFAQLSQLRLPQPVGFVNDFANVISPGDETRLEQIIQDVRAKSGGEIVVVTLPDLQGRDPAEVSLQIGRQWRVGARGGPGDRARNAGVVIMIVPKETSSDGRGHLRIETGMGAEGFLTDATTGVIQDEALPAFRQQDYGSGIALMTYRVAQRYAEEFQFQLDTALRVRMPERERPSEPGGIPPVLIFILIFVILSMLSSGRRGRRGCGGCMPLFLPFPGGGWGGGRGGWGGGSFGGGGGGFGGFGGFGGGGGFSGGGSGRSW